MANFSGIVGALRALLTIDTGQFDTGMRKAVTTTEKTTDSLNKLGQTTAKLAPQAERMVKAFGGDRLVSTANNLAAAIQKIGGASKLTEAEQARANATFTAAAAKLNALGRAAEAARFQKFADETKAAATSTSLFDSTLAKLTASFTLANLITRATGALVNFGREAISSAGALVDMSSKTGLSTELLQRMQFVAGQTGATLEDFTTTSFRLGIAIASGTRVARDAFDDLAKSSDALGVSFEQFQQLRPDEQFLRVLRALHDVQDEQERNRLGVALMGRQYMAIAASVTENFEQIAKAARIATNEQIRAVDEAADAWNKFINDTTTGTVTLLGNLLLMRDRTNALVEARKRLQAQGVQITSDEQIFAEAQRAAQEKARAALDKTTESAKKVAVAADFYRQQLAAVREALNNLTPAQRAEIDAALELGAKTEDLETQFKLMPGALALYKSSLKSVESATKDVAKAQTELRDNINALHEDIEKVAGPIEQAIQRAFDADNLEDFRAQLRFIENELNNAQDISDSINKNIGSLDEERMRRLLAANPPGSGIFKEAGGQIGTTMGAEMQAKLKTAFADIPHFLTSSVLHSGSFLNGLKALGVSMADAIVEPLLKQFALKLAGAKIASAVAGGVGGAAVLGGTAAAAGTVAAEVGGTAAATTAAVSGGAGGAAAAGGGFSSALAGFATNPITLAVAGAAVGGLLIARHFRKGARANDTRDKDLAQFAGFDTAADKQDTANPPGFHGLDRLLTKYKKHELFAPFITAKDQKSVRANFAPIQAFMATLGRNVKSFNMGGWIPPGVTQPAILHGGAYGETITPDRAPGSSMATHNTYITVQGVLDAGNFRQLLREHGFEEIGKGFFLNAKNLTTNARRALDR